MGGGVRLHLPELVGVVCPSLLSSSWSVKRQAASAIATITETMGEKVSRNRAVVVVVVVVVMKPIGIPQGLTWLPLTCLL